MNIFTNLLKGNSKTYWVYDLSKSYNTVRIILLCNSFLIGLTYGLTGQNAQSLMILGGFEWVNLTIAIIAEQVHTDIFYNQRLQYLDFSLLFNSLFIGLRIDSWSIKHFVSYFILALGLSFMFGIIWAAAISLVLGIIQETINNYMTDSYPEWQQSWPEWIKMLLSPLFTSEGKFCWGDLVCDWTGIVLGIIAYLTIQIIL